MFWYLLVKNHRTVSTACTDICEQGFKTMHYEPKNEKGWEDNQYQDNRRG